MIAMAQGRPVAVLEGPQQEDDLTAWIDQILSTVGRHLPGIPEEDTSSTARPDEEAITDPRLDAAEEALNSGNFAVALDMYDSIIADDPQNDDAKAARAHVPLLQRITDAQAAGEPVTEPGRTFLHADRYMVSSQEEEAFRVLLDLLKSSAGEQKTRVKDRLIELFALCDPADSRVISARREMASLLF